MAAMRAVLDERGSLGFNAKFMIETGEENGSAGVYQVVEANMDAFSADVFIASDGPRVQMDRPTVCFGARGALNFDLICHLREGGHHSGNWGGLLANPGIILTQALATITIQAARILGIDARVGSLEVGKDGDVALYDGDPFEYTSHCIGVVIDGRVVSEEKR